MKLYSFLILLPIVFISCEKPKNDSKAQHIIDECIEKHGGKNYEKFDISFNFRKFRVKITQDLTHFRYERTTKDSLNNEIKDILSTEGFKREINGKKIELSEKDTDKYKEGTNSIAYFVLLPYKLKDKAVNLKYVGETTIEKQKYDKIEVWFDAEGGGKDHEDVFCYWINQATQTLDYLAYANGGSRFRKATKRETVSGIIFQDYENYEVLDSTLSTTQFDQAFKNGKVKLLSKIEQSNYIAHTAK